MLTLRPVRLVCRAALLLLCLALLGHPLSLLASPGPLSFHVRPLSPTASQIVVQNLGTASGAKAAIAWDIYFNFDHSKGRLAGITPGSDWEAMDCSFATNVSDGIDALPSRNDVIINGFCTTRIPPGLVKDETVVATLNWADCRGGFIVDLRTGVAEFGSAVTDMVDVNNEAYHPTDTELFDGGACGDTTVGLQTTLVNPVPSVAASSLSAPMLAALAGGLILLVAAVFALLRGRKAA